MDLYFFESIDVERSEKEVKLHTSGMRATYLLTLATMMVFSVGEATFSGAKPTKATGAVLAGVPLVRQTYNACGPASITQVLGYYGLNVRMEDVSRQTRPNENAYMTAHAIARFAPTVGMKAKLYTGGSLNVVRLAIQNGLPLIALQSYTNNAGRVIPHWRVIVGYDDYYRQAYLMDPLLGYVTMDYQDFSDVWARQQGQFAVMYPPAMTRIVDKYLG